SHNFFRRVPHAIGDREVEPRFGEDFAALLDVGAFHAYDDGNLDVEVAGRGHHSSSQRVAAQNTSKNIDQHGLHIGVREQDTEGVLDLFRAGPSADVEEVRRTAACVLDDVHRAHGKPGAVHHASNIAVQLDVV